MLLTKSDFKVAQSCPTKLFYRKRKFPTTLEDNEYLQFLADGGYMIEALARLHFPGGTEMPFVSGTEAAVADSTAAFNAATASLFEPTFLFRQSLARIDILDRKGDSARLIEVKAKSIDTSEDLEKIFWARDGVRSEWKPYLEDITFQVLVMRGLYPDITFTPVLCMPDKSRTTSIDLLHKHFIWDEAEVVPGARFSRPSARFVGDEDQARKDSFLAFVDVSEWVGRLAAGVEASVAFLMDELRCGEVKAKPVIGTKCKACEFRVSGKEPSGFVDCWGNLTEPDPHILDFYFVGQIGGRGAPVINNLISQGKAAMADVPEDSLTNSSGEIGAQAERQRLQRQHTLAGTEYRSQELARILNGHSYPLHFIDFEASRIAIPYHAGMRPYEQVCFQWSCHTIREPGAQLEHSEWINVDDVYPNVAFAEALAKQVGTQGTIYIWSKFELSALKEIQTQFDQYKQGDPDVLHWLDLVLDGDPTGSLKVVDMIDLAKPHYFHPMMKGRLSIKYVLPATWGESPDLWHNPEFACYYASGPDGKPANPYDTLPPLPFGEEEADGADAVREGTGAIRAYQELLYGVSATHPDKKEAWRQSLLQYCKLDTAAMVIIWAHWGRQE
jgi:hypothetical protein